MSFRWFLRVVISTVVPISGIAAAEDDAVMGGIAIQDVAPPEPQPSKIVRVMRDGKLVILFIPKDRSGDVPTLEPQLIVFLEKVQSACSLSDDQMRKAKLAAKRDIQRVTQKPEPIELVEDVVNGKTVLRVADKMNAARLSPNPNLITTESFVYKVLMTQLTPEQKRKFEALRDREFTGKVFRELK